MGNADWRGVGRLGAELRGGAGRGGGVAPQCAGVATAIFVRGLTVLGPLSFMVAALIVYWSTWPTLSWLLGLQVLAFALYVLYRLPSREGRTRLLRQVCASLWLIVFFVLVMLVSWAGTFGGHGWIAYRSIR